MIQKIQNVSLDVKMSAMETSDVIAMLIVVDQLNMGLRRFETNIDIKIPYQSLEKICSILSKLGFVDLYGEDPYSVFKQVKEELDTIHTDNEANWETTKPQD